jgi:hypothetical protein
MEIQNSNRSIEASVTRYLLPFDGWAEKLLLHLGHVGQRFVGDR